MCAYTFLLQVYLDQGGGREPLLAGAAEFRTMQKSGDAAGHFEGVSSVLSLAGMPQGACLWHK